ncbi:MAG: GntR family transcriptional regulator [Propionibacteriaceae bacterium]|jgi:DNA-binding GntR family transcriptional regulator|nr:GntR family transcriptional regulator [Propionibacteriaceae bacterium]
MTGAAMDLTANYYLRLREDILAGEFPVGAQLLETTLATRYGVSRTPIREALALLEHDGLIERVSRGFRVRAGTPQDVLEAYEARVALEPAAAAAAAQRSGDLELVQLARLQEKAEQATEAAELRRLHAQWHECLWQAGHNAFIAAALARIMAQLRIYDQGEPPPSGDYSRSNADHAAILDACRDRDADRARALMADHLGRSRSDRLESLLGAWG